jgi:hypothetical protein
MVKSILNLLLTSNKLSVLVLLLLDLHHVAHSDLGAVVHDVFVVVELNLPLSINVTLVIVDNRSVGDLHSVWKDDGMLVTRTAASAAFHTVIGVLELLDELSLVKFFGLA